MNINILNFKNVIQKSTLNFSIPSVQLKFEDDKIKSSMISDSRDVIVIVDIENTVISANDIEFNFSEPSVNLIPFLNLVDEDEADINIKNEKIILKSGSQKSDVHFCSPTVVGIFGSREPKEGIEYFTKIDIDDTFVENFKKLKKIGSRFGKIYFIVDNKKFLIETTDKTNRFSNSLKFNIIDIENEDLTMCFDYQNLSNLMMVIGDRVDEFVMEFAYIEEQEKGMLYAYTSDNSENYYLMSKD